MYCNFLSGISESLKIITNNGEISILDIIQESKYNLIQIHNEVHLPITLDISYLNYWVKTSVNQQQLKTLSFYGRSNCKEYIFNNGEAIVCIPEQEILIEKEDMFIWKPIDSVKYNEKIVILKNNKVSFLFKERTKILSPSYCWSLKNNKLDYYILNNGIILK